MYRESPKKGFSLIELVIVIVILGIIAAIAIPRVTSGSKNASESALRANLQSLRNSIDWYYGQHGNNFPGAKGDGTAPPDTSEAFISQLTQYSKADGTVSATKDPAFPFGPYLRSFPKLPVGTNVGSATVSVVNQPATPTAAPAGGEGWVYNTATGEIIANSTDPGNDGTTYNTY